jgi:hypothetical protein
MSRHTNAKDNVVQHVQDLLSRLKLVDNFDWGSLEGCRFESTRTKWSKNATSEGVIGEIDHDGNRIVAHDDAGNVLFSIGGDSPWKWSYKDQVVSVSVTQSALLPVDLGNMPYTEQVKYRIYIPE